MDTCERGISHTVESARTIANGFIGIKNDF